MSVDPYELHDEAMVLLDEAERARKAGNDNSAKDLTVRAFEMEKQAAMEYLNDFDLSSARSMLFSSATALALEIDRPREALDLAQKGLQGEPDEEFVHDLERYAQRAQSLLDQLDRSKSVTLSDLLEAARGVPEKENVEVLTRMKALRNLLVHSASVIDVLSQSYVRSLLELATDNTRDEVLKIGTRVVLEPHTYLAESLSAVVSHTSLVCRLVQLRKWDVADQMLGGKSRSVAGWYAFEQLLSSVTESNPVRFEESIATSNEIVEMSIQWLDVQHGLRKSKIGYERKAYREAARAAEKDLEVPRVIHRSLDFAD